MMYRMSVSYGQPRGTLGVPASRPLWMTSTSNTPSGECVHRGVGSSDLLVFVSVQCLNSFFLHVSLFRVGQVVNIKAKVNRAFNTSMEVR